MSDTQQTATETAEKTQTDTGTVENQGVKDSTQETNPYKAELEKVQKAEKEKTEKLSDLNKALAEERRLRKEAEQALEDNSNSSVVAEETDNKALEELKNTLKGLDQKITTLNEKTELESSLNSLASNEDEKTLIKYHLDNSVNPALSLKDRLLLAKTMANKHLVEEELKKVQTTKTATGVGQSYGSGKGVTNTVTAEVAALLMRIDPSGKALEDARKSQK